MDTVTVTGGSISGSITTTDDGSKGAAITFNSSGGFTTGGAIATSGNKLTTATVSGGAVTLANDVYATNVRLDGGTATLSTNVTTGATAVQFGSGTLSLATNQLSIGAATLTTATGNSTLNLTIGSAVNGKIVSSGAITNNMAAGGRTVYISPTVSGRSIANGDKFIVVSTGANGISNANQFALVSGSGGALLSWGVSQVSTGNDAYGNAIGTGGDIVLTATITNASSLSGVSASSVQSVNAATSSGAPSAVSSAVLNLSSASEVNKAGEQLRPSTNGGQTMGAMQATTQVFNVVGARSDSVRLAQSGGTGTGISTGEAMRGLGMWGQGFGFYGDQGTIDSIDGYTAATGGLAFGGDARVTDSTRVGLAFSWANTDVDSKGANSGSGTKINSYQGTLYTNYTGSPWYLNGALGLTYHDYDSTRLVSFTGFSDTARASFHGWQYTAKVDGGYPIPVGPAVVTPVAGMSYSLLRQDGYTETSSNGAALTVNSNSTTSVKSMLGAKAAHSLAVEGYRVTPEVRASWQHEFRNEAQQSTAQFAAGGSAFTSTGARASADSAVLGLGVTVANADNISASLNYDAELREKYVGHTGMLQVRAEF